MKKEGTVSWFNEFKGFGFITTDDGQDVYVNYTEILRDGFQTLNPGERVRFTFVDDEGGPKATQVEIVAAASKSE